MKIIGVIPARYHSSRFPGKPLADLCGKPMFWWVYQQAKKAKLDEVYLATDDERIYRAAEELGVKVLMTSTEHKTPNDRVYEVSTMVEGDIFLCINGDEPLIDPAVIERSLPEPGEEDLLEYYYSNVMTAVKDPVEAVDPSNIKAVVNEKGDALWISRSPIPYPKGNMDFTYKKLVGIAAMSRKALEFYYNTPRSHLEEVEELDMYRFLEHHMVVRLKEIECHTLSVDTPKDLEHIRKIMTEKAE